MIIMILGMHRSGTSTISGVLHMNGIIMGTYQNFWPRPLNQNPKGFYENFDFRKINDQLLNRAGYDVKSYIPEIPNIQQIDSLSDKMKLIIKKSNSSYQDWGWKDRNGSSPGRRFHRCAPSAQGVYSWVLFPLTRLLQSGCGIQSPAGVDA